MTFVSDGDTVDVRIPGEGERQIRFSGINAMELQRYSSTPSKRAAATATGARPPRWWSTM